MAGKKTRSVRTEEAQAEVRAAASSLTPKEVMEGLVAGQLSVQSAIAGISAEVTALFEQRATLEKDIALKRAELKSLFDIEAQAETLEKLKEEIENTRGSWSDEQKQRDVDRRREEEQFTYDRNLRRSRQLAEFKEQDETLKKGWAEREQGLKDREAKIDDLENQIKGFPDKLLAATEEGKKSGIAEAGRDWGFESRALKQKHEGEIALLKQNVENLSTTLKNQEVYIQGLRLDLSKANQDTKDLAKSITEASGQKEVVANLQRALELAGQKNTK